MDYKICPKIELHIHLDGAVRGKTIYELFKSKNIELHGDGTFEGFQEYFNQELGSLDEFLKLFDVIYKAIKGDLKAIERISYELCQDQSKEGVIYFETRFSPHLLIPDENHEQLTPSMITESVLKGLKRGEKDFNIKARVILCCIRGQPAWSSEVVDLCHKYKDQGVVGIDIACNEGDGVLEGYNTKTCELTVQDEDVKAFQKAYELGIHRTAHACEIGPPVVAESALNDFHVERIGHGYYIIQDQSLYENIQNMGIHLECCPKSSFLTGIKKTFSDHPIKRFAKDRCNFSINTDDPVLTGTWISDELRFTKELGLTDEDLKLCNFNAANAAFLPENEKKELVELLESYYNSLK